MALTSQVQDMQRQGMNDEEIIQQLKEQGYSPMEISQSMEQAKIKGAVTQEIGMEGMQTGLMEQPQEQYQPQAQPYPQQYQQEQYPSQAYPQYQQYQSASSETMTEIAEQIAEEKIRNLKKSIGNIEELKTNLTKKVENIQDRLRKIEDTMDKMQQAILGKVMGYGQNIEEIKDELGMIQESFAKAVGPMVDRAREHHKETKAEKHEEHSRKKSDGFENYLR